jgi:hypothetical protein
MNYITAIIAILFFFFLPSCQKEKLLIDGNKPLSTTNISEIKIENYVQRLFIDLLGREPLPDEMETYVDKLKKDSLNRNTREEIIKNLMENDSLSAGEGSYKKAYNLNLYNLGKIRCIEGLSDFEIEEELQRVKNQIRLDSLAGNWDSFGKNKKIAARFEKLLISQIWLYQDKIAFYQLFYYLVDNGIYDIINMNTFNFIRAIFDDLLYRLPTQEEYNNAFQIIENQVPRVILGTVCRNKEQLIETIVQSSEMMEGLVIWSFQVLLKRNPKPEEVATFLPTMGEKKEMNELISKILITDEYANFY